MPAPMPFPPVGRAFHAGCSAATTSRARGSPDSESRRNCSGSRPEAIATSSRNDSLANEFEKPPSERRAVVRRNRCTSGVAALRGVATSVLKLRTSLGAVRWFEKLYVTGELLPEGLRELFG